MITSIFSKSKPINFIVVFVVIALATTVGCFKTDIQVLSWYGFLKWFGLLMATYFSALTLNFIATKNNLSQTANFEVVLFGLFTLLVAETTIKFNIILANIFLLFALRRLISLRSQRHVKQKLFDVALWVCIAALCYAWAILFFILVPLAILLYTDKELRHWLIPFASIFAVFTIASSYSILAKFNLLAYFVEGLSISVNFTNYNSLAFIIGLTVLLSFGAWSFVFYIKAISLKKKALRPSFYLIAYAVVLSFIIVLIAPNKTGAELLFMFAPLAIVMANYIEIISDKWFKELFFCVLLLVPFLLLVL